MKKAFFSFFITFLLVSSVAFAESIETDNPYISFAEASDYFTIAPTKKSVEVGDSILIAYDEVAKESCSLASLYQTAKDGNSKTVVGLTGPIVTKAVNQGTVLSQTMRVTIPSGYTDGNWVLSAYIRCLTNNKIISETSYNNIQVSTKTTCESGWVSDPFCDKTVNAIYRTYLDCVNSNGIESNKQIVKCTSTQICENRACRELRNDEQPVTVCSSRGGHICSEGQICSTNEYSDLIGCCINECSSPSDVDTNKGVGDWIKQNKIIVLVLFAVVILGLIFWGFISKK